MMKHLFTFLFIFHAALYSFQDNKPVDPALVTKIKQIIDDNQPLHIGFHIQSLKTGESITVNENHLFLPASNTKLLTTLLALETLGSAYRFETLLLTDGVIKKHTLKGNVYLKGSGDPTLTSTDLADLIKTLHTKGVRTITGDFCLDRDDFDYDCFVPGEVINNLGFSWNPGVSAFIVDGKPIGIYETNTVHFMDQTKVIDMFFDGVTLLETLLEKYSIRLEGKIVLKKAPASAQQLAIHTSEPLPALLAVVMKNSDNLYSNCLFKRIGATIYSTPGTWQKGINAMKHFLHTKVGFSPESFSIMDGAGRSRYNLLSPAQIIMLLTWATKQPYYSLFLDTLAHGDGTLSKRMPGIAHRIKAKTGTLSGVSSLLGYIEFDHDTLAFSIFTNGYISRTLDDHPCKASVEDALCTLLVSECYTS